MKLHRHMEDGLVVVSCGEEYDCPAERGCWFEGEESEIGREVRTERGAVWVGRERGRRGGDMTYDIADYQSREAQWVAAFPRKGKH